MITMMFRLAHNLTQESRRKLSRLYVDSFSSGIKHEITLQHQFREKIRELGHVFFNYSGNKKTITTMYSPLQPCHFQRKQMSAKSESVLNKLLPFKTFHVRWILLVIHTRLLLPHRIALLSFSTSSESKERPVRGRPGRRFGDSIYKIPFSLSLGTYRSEKHHAQVLQKSLTIICLSGTTDDWI